MKYFFATALIALIASCGANQTENSQPEKDSFKVEFKGALKDIMHKSDLSAKISLTDFKNTEHLFAIGALENLKGEIQIFDGTVYNSKVLDSTLVIDSSLSKNACLLVYAKVDNWESYSIPDSIISYAQLEVYIEKTALKHQLNTDEPFPFLIEGIAKSFDWHVINWKDGDTDHSHEKHINSGLNGTVSDKAVNMLGFYSNAHHAIFTHHTTNMHIHVKTIDESIAGHVDDLVLGTDMVLKLPVVYASNK